MCLQECKIDTSCVGAGLLLKRQYTTVLALAAMTSGQGWTLPGTGTPLGVIVAPTVATALSVRSPSGPAATKAHGMTGLLTTLLPVHDGCVCQCCAMVVLDAQVK